MQDIYLNVHVKHIEADDITVRSWKTSPERISTVLANSYLEQFGTAKLQFAKEEAIMFIMHLSVCF